jgi:hypothetical protein
METQEDPVPTVLFATLINTYSAFHFIATKKGYRVAQRQGPPAEGEGSVERGDGGGVRGEQPGGAVSEVCKAREIW